MKKILRDYLIVSLGVFIMAFGLSLFLMPFNLAVGGVMGFAMIVNNILPSIPLTTIMIFMNIILFIIGFILIGKQFGFKTIYASFALSISIGLLEKLYPITNPLVEDIFLSLLVGIIIQGIGMAIIFYENASTGGTDIIAKILNKYYHMEIGTALFLSDAIITLLAGLTFGLETGLYSFIGILFNSLVIDNVINSLGLRLNISIISNYPDEITKFINKDLNRGTTIYQVKGGYTDSNQFMVNSVMNRRELSKLKNNIQNIDDSAFITISNVKEVLGNGFDI